MIIEIDGTFLRLRCFFGVCASPHFVTVTTGVRVSLMDDQYLDCKDPIGQDGVLLRTQLLHPSLSLTPFLQALKSFSSC
jgi:hypothetical protein